MSDLVQLRSLDLSDNFIDGFLIPELSVLTELTSLRLHKNSFVGRVPAYLLSLSNLKEIKLFRNMLTGYVPASVEEMKAHRDELAGPEDVVPRQLRGLTGKRLTSAIEILAQEEGGVLQKPWTSKAFVEVEDRVSAMKIYHR